MHVQGWLWVGLNVCGFIICREFGSVCTLQLQTVASSVERACCFWHCNTLAWFNHVHPAYVTQTHHENTSKGLNMPSTDWYSKKKVCDCARLHEPPVASDKLDLPNCWLELTKHDCRVACTNLATCKCLSCTDRVDVSVSECDYIQERAWWWRVNSKRVKGW